MGTRAIAITAVLILSAINYRGVRQAVAVQAVFTSVKCAARDHPDHRDRVHIRNAHQRRAVRYKHARRDNAKRTRVCPRAHRRAYLRSAAGNTVSCTPRKKRSHPTRDDTARSWPENALTVTALYVALNAAYLRVLPLATVAKSTRVAADFADAAVGGHGAQFMSALVILSTIGGMNGVILAVGRACIPRWRRTACCSNRVGAVHPEHRTPHRAIAPQAVWSGLSSSRLAHTRRLFTRGRLHRVDFLRDACGGSLSLARPGYNPPYRVWGYPILPAVFVVSTAAIVINQIIAQPVDSIGGLAFVLLGLPVYYIWARNPPPSNRSPTA